MNKLELNSLCEIQGGGGREVVDGICAAVGVAGLLRFVVPGLGYAAIACAGWGIGRGMGWI